MGSTTRCVDAQRCLERVVPGGELYSEVNRADSEDQLRAQSGRGKVKKRGDPLVDTVLQEVQFVPSHPYLRLSILAWVEQDPGGV